MTDVLSTEKTAPDLAPAAIAVGHTSFATWWTTVIVLAAGVWAALGSLWLFPLLTDNADEGAYLSQSAALRAGHLLPPAPSLFPEAFHPWFSALIDGSFVYKYTPVHASLIATAHTLFGSDRALLVLVAMADVALLALLARELGASRAAAGLACLVFVLSPLWIIQSATFLPYASTLVFLQGFALLMLRGFRTRSRLQITLAGALASVAVFARPFDGLLFVSTVLAWQLWHVRRTGRVGLVGWFVLGGLPALGLFLAYNVIAAGGAFHLAFHVTGSSDTLGFGARHVLRTDRAVDYTVWKAVGALTNNMKRVITWSFGSFLVLVFAGIGFSNIRDLKGRTLLALLLVVWPLGFFFFWGAYASVLLWDITRFLGPFYYIPMLVALAIGAGVGIARVAHGRAWLGAIIIAVLAAVTLPTLLPALETNRERTAQHRVIYDAVQPLERSGPKLLFLPPLYGGYLQNPFPFLRNAPDYDGHIVYAIDGGNRNFHVIDEFPERTAFSLSVPSGYEGDRSADQIKALVDRVRRVRGTVVSVKAHVSPLLMRREAVLSVAVGSAIVPVHFASDGHGGGITRFDIARANGVVALSDPDNPGAFALTKNVRHALRVGVIVGPGNPPSMAYGKIIPIRSRARGFELLMPGTVSDDHLGLFEQATIKVTVSH